MRPNLNGRKARLLYAAASTSLLALPATAIALNGGQSASPRGATHTAAPIVRAAFTKPVVSTAKRRGCDKLFTVAMGERAANRFYSGTAAPSRHELKVLGYIERCQRNRAAQGFVRGYDQQQRRAQRARVAIARAAAAARSHYGGWAIPASVVQCESGGQNLPPNSAGASGYYQIIPSTWQAYGGGQFAPSADQATGQEQAVIAAKIWDGGAGASQWVCAGG